MQFQLLGHYFIVRIGVQGRCTGVLLLLRFGSLLEMGVVFDFVSVCAALCTSLLLGS